MPLVTKGRLNFPGASMTGGTPLIPGGSFTVGGGTPTTPVYAQIDGGGVAVLPPNSAVAIVDGSVGGTSTVGSPVIVGSGTNLGAGSGQVVAVRVVTGAAGDPNIGLIALVK